MVTCSLANVSKHIFLQASSWSHAYLELSMGISQPATNALSSDLNISYLGEEQMDQHTQAVFITVNPHDKLISSLANTGIILTGSLLQWFCD